MIIIITIFIIIDVIIFQNYDYDDYCCESFFRCYFYDYILSLSPAERINVPAPAKRTFINSNIANVLSQPPPLPPFSPAPPHAQPLSYIIF